MGLRVRRGVTGHGFALNVSTDLTHYQHLLSCGLADRGVTSLEVHGCALGLENLAERVAAALAEQFGLCLDREKGSGD